MLAILSLIYKNESIITFFFQPLLIRLTLLHTKDSQMKKQILSTLVLSLGLCYTNVAKAQWSTDVSINTPVCVATGTKGGQKIMTDGHGGAFVTWQDDRLGNNDIYIQHFDSTGTALWSTNGELVCTASSGQIGPVMCPDGNDGVIVTWQDDRTPVSGTDIYAQRLDANGNILWTYDGVPVCTAVGQQTAPVILSDNAGGAYVSWFYDDRSGEYDVYLQHIDNSGAQVWTINGINVSLLSGDQRAPSLATDGSGGVIITWNYYTGTSTDVYAQRFNLAGIAQWITNGVVICGEATAEQFNPKITSDNNGGAIITWLDYRVSAGDIYAQRVNASGIVQWTANGVAVCNASEYQGEPVIISDNNGGAYIAWEDYRNTIDSDIYAQHLNASGTMLWAINGLVIGSGAGNQEQIALYPDGNGNAFIAWRDFRNMTDFDIYTQKINATGVIQWSAGGVTLANGTYDQYVVDIISDNNGGVIIVFQETLGSNIFIQNACFSGAPGPLVNPVITIAEYVNSGNWFSPSGGTASASSTLSPGSPSGAFDGDTALTGWASQYSFPDWLEYDFGAGNGKILTAYQTFYSYTQQGGWNAFFIPSDWTFEGYNGSSWHILDITTAQTPAFNVWNTYSFTNNIPYEKYRIRISANSFGGYAFLTEMRFFVPPPINLCSNKTYIANTNFPSAFASYDWLLNGVSLGVNNDTLTLPTSNNGDVLICKVTSGACVLSTNIDTSNIEVITTLGYPFINIIGDTTVCAGESTAIAATGGISYQWSNGSTSPSVSILPLVDSLFTVAVIDTNGCLGYKSQMIYVNPLPNVTASATTNTICAGGLVTLTGSGANAYTWSGGVMDAVAFAPSASTTYTVTGTDANGCTDTSSVVVNVNNLPNVTTTSSGITITANATGVTYQWIDCNNANTAISGETNASFTASANGNYAVVVTQGLCSDTSVCVAITTVGINSTFSNHNSELKIMPNPNNGAFTLKASAEGHYTLINELGQTLQSFSLNTINNYTISFTEIPEGLYFVHCAETGSRQKMVVIK